jgi:tRNA threonylcarbamoyl adenosine modification protein YeaZ
MRVLGLETSTAHGSVAVFAYGELVFEERFLADRSHSSTLFAALEKARATAARFDRIAVGLGPGSYAGVRISIAAALGLNFVLDAELVGIPSVAALDAPVPAYLAIGDARRDAFYFTAVDHGRCIAGPALDSEEGVRQAITELGLPVFGTEPIPAFPSALVAIPSAAIIARLAAQDCGILQRGDLEPLYLREPHITQPGKRGSLPGGSPLARTKE